MSGEVDMRIIKIAEQKLKEDRCPELCTDARIALRLCFGHPEFCTTCDLHESKDCNWGIEAVKRWKAGCAYYDEFLVRKAKQKQRERERKRLRMQEKRRMEAGA